MRIAILGPVALQRNALRPPMIQLPWSAWPEPPTLGTRGPLDVRTQNRAAVDAVSSVGRAVVRAAGVAERTRVHDRPTGIVCRVAGPDPEGLRHPGPPGFGVD